MSIAQSVSYGSLVLFVGWCTELYATIVPLCHIASRMAGCLYDEWMYGSPLAAGVVYSQMHVLFFFDVLLGF